MCVQETASQALPEFPLCIPVESCDIEAVHRCTYAIERNNKTLDIRLQEELSSRPPDN